MWKTSRFQIQTIKDIKRLHQSSEIWKTDRIFFQISFLKVFSNSLNSDSLELARITLTA